MKRSILALTLLMAACLGWSPIHLPGEGGGVQPEMTQEQLAQQQMNYQGPLPTVGDVPAMTSPTPTEEVRSDPEASAVVSSTLDSDPQAEQIVRQAGEPKPVPNRTNSLLLGLLFVALGVGSVWGFRAWVGRQVPPMPTKSNKAKW